MLAQNEYEAPIGYPMGYPVGPTIVDPMMMAPLNAELTGHMNPYMMAPMGMPMAPPTPYFPGYGPQCEEEPALSAAVETGAHTEALTRQPHEEEHERLPHRAEMIYIADEYPPIILERIEKRDEAEKEGTVETVDDEEEIQQIPRAYIPRAAPRAASAFPQLFQYQPYQQTSPSRQSPGVRNSHRYDPNEIKCGTGRILRNAGSSRRPAPSNAPP
jgi:hypothetical protein